MARYTEIPVPQRETDFFNASTEGFRIFTWHAAGLPYGDFYRSESDGDVQTLLGTVTSLGRNFDRIDEFHSMVSYWVAFWPVFGWRKFSPKLRAKLAEPEFRRYTNEVQQAYADMTERATSGELVVLPWDIHFELVSDLVRSQAQELLNADNAKPIYNALVNLLTGLNHVKSPDIHSLLTRSGLPFGYLRALPYSEYLTDYLTITE